MSDGDESSSKGDEVSPELAAKIMERARQKLQQRIPPHQSLPPNSQCPHQIQVHGAHSGPNHHVHLLRPNRYECLICKVTFRFRKQSAVKRAKLLR